MKKNITDKFTISIYGAGYVGLATAALLSLHNSVTVYDVDKKRVDSIRKNISPIHDNDIKDFLVENPNLIKSSDDLDSGFLKSDFIVICTPTDYDSVQNSFNTSSVEKVIARAFKCNFVGNIIIKSTVPVGFTDAMCKKYNTDCIIFSPEFSREGKSLHDLWYPSRIIIGSNNEYAREFGQLLCKASKSNDPPLIFMNSNEAESVKLFSNTFLAMRVAFFNELDSFGLIMNLDVSKIIYGVCLDNRIGQYYNNPSFGYGGYCLPKDSQQLLSSFQDIPQGLVKATIESNQIRKKFIADHISAKKPKLVGIFLLAMKKDSDNFRNSSIHDIIFLLKELKISIVIYEPLLTEADFDGVKVLKSLNSFKKSCDLIIANRISPEIKDVTHKVFSRDIFNIE